MTRLEIIPNNKIGLNLGGVKRYFQPSFVLDKITVNDRCDNGTTRTHKEFLTKDFGLFGMSGGPVFDICGSIVGIQGLITDPRVSKNKDGGEISIENAVVIRCYTK